MADKYILRVTAGSTYDISKHVLVPVNSPETVKISTDLIDAEINVRVKNYAGLPHGAPSSSPYFETGNHNENNDQYSIAIRFTPKGEKGSGDGGISGKDLQFGNDFDHPIRDRLPYGFSHALNIVKWWVDPGLDGDPYADKPYMYGPALSSFNTLHVGAGEHDEGKGGLVFEEGGDEKGLETRRAVNAPDGAKERMKWALNDESKENWTWEYGKTYCVDLFNAFLDFSEFALRLPGYHLPIMKYWDGQGLRPNRKRSHALRYVLRNRTTEDVYLVVVFSLYKREDVNEDGTLKPSATEVEKGEIPDETPAEEPAAQDESLRANNNGDDDHFK
ncbi:hypothetical protein GGS20DRAFT_580909 [Poronia punctata]|nr:hypothetical protein GGS20DRAFT_580909 [Poronia punctata]